jgi:hypothetical protein
LLSTDGRPGARFSSELFAFICTESAEDPM